MQIPQVLASISFEIGAFGCCLFTIAFLFVKLIQIITGTYLIGIVLIIFGVYKLLRGVGTFALYPGCFRYIKSDIELRGSQRINQAIVKCTQELFNFLHHCQNHPDSAYLVPVHIVSHTRQMISMYDKFQPTLSPPKKVLLNSYRKLDEIFKQTYTVSDYTTTIQNFLNDPAQFRQAIQKKFGNSNQLKAIATYTKQKLAPVFTQIQQGLIAFHSPSNQGIIKVLLYKLYGQKTYEIRFGYLYWDQKYQYTVHQVETKKSDCVIECAVIKGQKGNPLQSTKAVLFCCPNGAYLQYFALESPYIEMYLELGYQIILWNYRGYGQSTGSPSISDALNDAQDVYSYCKRLLNLTPQIVHGYSIGGPPAVALAITHPIKVLVVDRSFCNFVNIAQQISPVLAKLARLVMRADTSINISELYLKAKDCRKILIWSPVDEVISNGSSLKLQILKKMQAKDIINDPRNQISQSSAHSTIAQDQLAQTDTFIQDKMSSTSTSASSTRKKKISNKSDKASKWIEKFNAFFQIIIVLDLFQAQKSSANLIKQENQNDIFSNSLMQEGPTQKLNEVKQNHQKREEEIVLQKFWQLVGHLDGGGTTISFLRQLCATAAGKWTQKWIQLHIQVKSFVLGLIFYGSCHRQNGKLDPTNLNNWEYTIGSTSKVVGQLNILLEEHKQRCSIELIQQLKIFQSVMEQILEYLKKSTKSNNSNSLGILIPTNSGHNGQLQKNQIEYLKAAITEGQSMLYQ